MAFAGQGVEQDPTDDRSHQTNHHVAEQPKPTAICHPPGEGTGDHADEDPSQDVVTGDGSEGEEHRLLPYPPVEGANPVRAQPRQGSSGVAPPITASGCCRDFPQGASPPTHLVVDDRWSEG